MQRIDAQGHAANKFVERNPATQTPGTLLSAAWLNAVQEEIVSVISSENITLDPKKQNQLLGSITAKISKAAESIRNELQRVDSSAIEFTDKTLFHAPTMESAILGQLTYTLLANKQVKCQLRIEIRTPDQADKDNYWLLFLPDGVPVPNLSLSLNAELDYLPSSRNMLVQVISLGTALFCAYPTNGQSREVTPGVASFVMETDFPNRLGVALMPTTAMRSGVGTIVADWVYTQEDLLLP